MSDALKLSEAKRAILGRYLHGHVPQAVKAELAKACPAKTEATDQRERVVPIQTGGSKRPFFYLHGDWGCKAFYCYPLAHELGADQPFYVLEPYTFDGLTVPPTFEAMAEAHLKSLRAVQPQGPYLLGGFCSGGLVAYEMARLLHAQDQKVDLLVLMDPDPPAPVLNSLVRGVIRRICDRLYIGQEKQLNWFLLYKHLRFVFRIRPRMRSLSRKLAKTSSPLNYWRASDFERLEATKQSGLNHKRENVTFPLPTPDWVVPTSEILHQRGIFHWVSADYTPGLYPGKITFFWSEDRYFRMSWRKVVEEKTNKVEVHMILGNHITSRTEHLSDLAGHLRDCISKVQEPMLR
jgi:hypothetical protein